MYITRLLILVSATLWALPGLTAPVVKPVSTCTCKIQPTPIITSSLEPFPPPIVLSFSPQTAQPPTWSTETNQQQIAEGSPAEDKGTPGNRGQCHQNQCNSQTPTTRNTAVPPK